MAWWTKIERADGKVEIEKHDGRRPKLKAAIALRFANSMDKVPFEKLGLYKRDPVKFPDEPNLLPEMRRKEEERQRAKLVKQIKDILKPRKKTQAT